jgi:hypothetical protein
VGFPLDALLVNSHSIPLVSEPERPC